MSSSVKIPRLLVAGTHSGVGKTTVTLGLALVLRRMGCTVQPFKVGPDYIDPGYLGRVAGRTCRNLDGWMIPGERLPALFVRACRGGAFGLVEGVMGLYDGIGAVGETGSTAEMAKRLRIPVLLVLDVSAMSRSAVALVQGFQRFDRGLKIAGCFLNRVGSPGHYRLVKESIERLSGVPVMGWLPRDPEIHLPERHLGLVPSEEGNSWQRILPLLERRMEEGLDRSRLLRLFRAAPPLPAALRPAVHPELGRRMNGLLRANGPVPIAVALDEAFHFYYPENLELLEDNGAEIIPFSPLKDPRLPGRVGALYLGGGFPETHAAELARNRSMRRQIREARASGLPIYAECGGLMYLSRSIRTSDGRGHTMVGLVPSEVQMTDGLQNFGYQEVRAKGSTLLARAGERARGHEFHHSILTDAPLARRAAYRVEARRGGKVRMEGYAEGSLLASYIHLHFWSQPRWAERFVQSARDYQKERRR